jgi:NADH:ubiquinone oxidoreductase subunit 3 (subunit A)
MLTIIFKLSIIYIESYNIFNKIYYGYFIEQHILLFIYVGVSLLLTVILLSLGFILSLKENTFEKSSSYECGFEPFSNGHLIFNIQFFIVGILFVIFDLELAYLFP